MLIIEPANRSGDWHYATMLSSALQDEGVDVRLATVFPFVPVPSPREIPIVRIGPRQPREFWPRGMALQRLWYYAAKIIGVFDVIVRLRPAVVHFQRQLGPLDCVCFWLIRRLGPRIVYIIHTPLPPHVSRLTRGRFRQVDLFLTHADRTKQQLIAAGVPEETIVKIPHGNYLYLCRPSDLPDDEARRLLGLPSGARVILFFGHIEWRKGLDRLIEAFALLARQHADLHLIIAGTANEDFAPYAQLIVRLGIQERVLVDLRWIAYSEMQRYFNAAFAVVLPYRLISQSGVIQLAYAYRRPVVVTDVGGIGEVVSEDGTGIVAESEAPEAIASAIQQLLSDSDAAIRMGERGRWLAETKYAWSGIARKVAACYREVEAGGPGAGRQFQVVPQPQQELEQQRRTFVWRR